MAYSFIMLPDGVTGTNNWLKEGDVVDFTIDKLGKLSNSIVLG